MKKETTKTVEVKSYERYCDICDTKLNWTLSCSVARCEVCKKELCEKCIGNEEGRYNDYRTVWCKRCWDIGNQYRDEINRLEKEIEKQHELWKRATIE